MHNAGRYQTRLDLGWLYSPQTTEEQQQGYLRGGGVGEAGAAEDQVRMGPGVLSGDFALLLNAC